MTGGGAAATGGGGGGGASAVWTGAQAPSKAITLTTNRGCAIFTAVLSQAETDPTAITRAFRSGSSLQQPRSAIGGSYGSAYPATVLALKASKATAMPNIIASIECSTCSAVLEIYRQEISGEPNLAWSTSDEGLCKAPPVRRCPHARNEIKRRFSWFDG